MLRSSSAENFGNNFRCKRCGLRVWATTTHARNIHGDNVSTENVRAGADERGVLNAKLMELAESVREAVEQIDITPHLGDGPAPDEVRRMAAETAYLAVRAYAIN